MNTLLWIVSGLLTLAFVAAGAFKISKSRAELRPKIGEWVDDFSDVQIKGIGAIEVVLALLMIGSTFAGKDTLAGLAAAALGLVMLCAVGVLLKRGDGFGKALPALVLGVLSAVVAVGRLAG